ncbi:MAG: cation:proton antiporter, partial [Rothia dentocariosa]
MLYLSVIVLILLATVIMVSVGDRLNLPWPVMMTILGVGALLLPPDRPHIEIDSDIILPIFLPPLLWAIGVKFSWGTLRRRWKSVLLYSVLLTTASALAVAGVALWWVPGMTVAVALALGAAVSPPDPVAVEAVAEPVGIPRRLIGTLQTEGSFNDAISIVLFHAAIHSMEEHHAIEPLEVMRDFALGSVLAVIIGFA